MRNLNEAGDAYKRAHEHSDVDRDRDALHHTLGKLPWQAAPGNHVHPSSGGGGPHTHLVADLSDATATTRTFLQQATPLLARAAIGAGVSDLAIGPLVTDAAAGNHDHTGVYANASHNHFVGDLANATALTKNFLQQGTNALAQAAINAADAAHTHPANDGWTEVILGADYTNSTVTLTDVLTLGNTLAIGTYIFEAYLAVKAAAATTGVQIGLAFGSGMEAIFQIHSPSSATADVMVNGRATGSKAASLAVPVLNAYYFAWGSGMLIVTTNPQGAATRLQANSEIAASLVTIKAGSVLRYKKIV